MLSFQQTKWKGYEMTDLSGQGWNAHEMNAGTSDAGDELKVECRRVKQLIRVVARRHEFVHCITLNRHVLKRI